MTDDGCPLGRTCPCEHPRVTTSICYICESSQHFAEDCTRLKGDPNTSPPSNMVQNKGNHG
eukprot:248076-Prorocentrum_lima.AAC.1